MLFIYEWNFICEPKRGKYLRWVFNVNVNAINHSTIQKSDTERHMLYNQKEPTLLAKLVSSVRENNTFYVKFSSRH